MSKPYLFSLTNTTFVYTQELVKLPIEHTQFVVNLLLKIHSVVQSNIEFINLHNRKFRQHKSKLPIMNIQFLKYFVVLAETESFTKGAEKMHVVQSSFSAGIKKLEEHLNCKLFYRNKRNVSLTEEGAILLSQANELLALWSNIEFKFKDVESNNLHIGILKNLHHTDIIVPHLKRFKEFYKNSKIHLVEESQTILLEKLHKDELDLVFVEVSEINKAIYKSRHVYEEKLELLIRKDHPLAKKDKIEMEALNHLPYIEHKNCALLYDVQESLSAKNITLNAVFSAQHNDVLMSLVASGMGVALMAKPKVYSDELKFIPVVDSNFKRDIVLVWKSANQNKMLEKFLEV